MDSIHLSLLKPHQIAAAVVLDQHCLGGMWTADGYQREIDSPNSVLLVLSRAEPPSGSVDEQGLPLDAEAGLIGLACLWMILEEAHITILAVHPMMRGRGLGQLLLTALMQAAWQRDMSWATLEVRASNQKAIALYRKFGFADVGLRPRYYQNPEEDALILWRKGLQDQEFGETLRIWWSWVGDRRSQQAWRLTLDRNLADFQPLPLDISLFS